MPASEILRQVVQVPALTGRSQMKAGPLRLCVGTFRDGGLAEDQYIFRRLPESESVGRMRSMKRREFLKSSALVAGTAAVTNLFGAEKEPVKMRRLFELRKYHLRRGPMQKRFDDFYRDAAIPAMNRAGMSPIGVFSVMTGPDSPTFYVLIPHDSAELMVGATDRIRADADYQKAGKEFLDASPSDPSYIRVESWLLKAFETMPGIEVPVLTTAKKSRLFELRTYESHSKRANKKKVEMFDNSEIAIFRKTGLTPVFFGETIIGSNMPSLTYMLVFENMPEHDKNWSTFASDPEWKKLSTTPGFTDGEIVSNISNLFLRPAAYSQI